ncbi:MAG TPA: hypothetical protein VLZ05_04910 [Mycobacterium sp.]|nr:hypothetical protein [Mycobacterium sp.]
MMAAASTRLSCPELRASLVVVDAPAVLAAFTTSRDTENLATFVADSPASIIWMSRARWASVRSFPIVGDDLLRDPFDGLGCLVRSVGGQHVDRHGGQTDLACPEHAALAVADQYLPVIEASGGDRLGTSHRLVRSSSLRQCVNPPNRGIMMAAACLTRAEVFATTTDIQPTASEQRKFISAPSAQPR